MTSIQYLCEDGVTRYTPVVVAMPFGPGTHLYAREIGRRDRKAAMDASYAKMLADNPGFAAVIPQLDELAGVYAVGAGV